MLIYGIDPGYTGAVSLYWTETGKLECYDMPTLKNPKGKTLINLHELLRILSNEADESCLAVDRTCLGHAGAGCQ